MKLSQEKVDRFRILFFRNWAFCVASYGVKEQSYRVLFPLHLEIIWISFGMFDVQQMRTNCHFFMPIYQSVRNIKEKLFTTDWSITWRQARRSSWFWSEKTPSTGGGIWLDPRIRPRPRKRNPIGNERTETKTPSAAGTESNLTFLSATEYIPSRTIIQTWWVSLSLSLLSAFFTMG